jgi:hypothetical protein
MARHTAAVQSSWLLQASYDDETKSLTIQTRSGKAYTYSNVPMDIYEGLRDASSPGQYWGQNIKGVYE